MGAARRALMFTRIVIGALWLLHWLPLPVLAAVGAFAGTVLRLLARERRMVAATNLRLCFPDWDETRRKAVLRAHFVAVARGLLEGTIG